MSIKLDLHGLDKFEKSLINMVEVKFPKGIEDALKDLAEKLYKEALGRTPIGEKEYFYSKGKKRKVTPNKRMKNRWRIGKVRASKAGYFIEVKNTSPHAHLVEDGHRMFDHDGNIIGFVEGQKVLQISVSKLHEELPDIMRKWLDEMLRELAL